MVGASAPQLGMGKLRGLRVLIAEDSWLVADTLAVGLEEEGANVLGPTPTCAKARAILSETTVDFAVVDMNLGDEFADALIDDLTARRVPYAILTGYRTLPSNSGDSAVQILRKPVDMRSMVDLLSRYVPRQRES